MTINNPTVSVAGSFETDGNGTVGYDVENESPREWRRWVNFSGELAQTRDNPQLREEAEWRRACMQKESFMQILGMFSEAQDNEKEW